MAAGQKHHSVGTLHIKVGHAIVFERETHLEDEDGTKHPLKQENRVVNWEEAKDALSDGEISALESIQKKVLAFDDAREKATVEAKAKAEADAKKKADAEAKKKAKADKE